jgi:hypothetical protein
MAPALHLPAGGGADGQGDDSGGGVGVDHCSAADSILRCVTLPAM